MDTNAKKHGRHPALADPALDLVAIGEGGREPGGDLDHGLEDATWRERARGAATVGALLGTATPAGRRRWKLNQLCRQDFESDRAGFRTQDLRIKSYRAECATEIV